MKIALLPRTYNGDELAKDGKRFTIKPWLFRYHNLHVRIGLSRLCGDTDWGFSQESDFFATLTPLDG
jgi:hypothetical protein